MPYSQRQCTIGSSLPPHAQWFAGVRGRTRRQSSQITVAHRRRERAGRVVMRARWARKRPAKTTSDKNGSWATPPGPFLTEPAPAAATLGRLFSRTPVATHASATRPSRNTLTLNPRRRAHRRNALISDFVRLIHIRHRGSTAARTIEKGHRHRSTASRGSSSAKK